MSEEKNEAKKEEIVKEEVKPEAAKPKATAPAPAAPSAASPEPAKKDIPKKEKPSACVGCKKSIKKKRWYYRDGNYYCTKRCWVTAVKKAQKKEEAPAAA